jgi:hypothetical protein
MWSSDVITFNTANKNALIGSTKKAQEHRMTQVSPEVKNNFREDTLPENMPDVTTTDVIILGEDRREDVFNGEAAFVHVPSSYDPDLIGPRDASDDSRRFLMRRAEDLAQIAVLNFGAYEGERARLVETTRQDVSEGHLRLNGEYKKMTADQQIEHFVMDAVNGSLKPRDEIVSDLAAERVAQDLGSRDAEQALQLEVDTLKELVLKQSGRILKVREMLVERGATEEFMREFDYTTKIMTKPDAEAYELEMKLDPDHETPPLVDTGAIRLFDKFMSVLSPSFGRKALRSIGILPPKSGEVQVVKQ